MREADRSRAQADAQARETAERSRGLAADEMRLAAQRVESAEKLRGIEGEVASRATEVSDLSERRSATEARLRLHAAALAPLLPLVERLALYPAETLLAVPAPPEDALRGLGLLRGMARRLEREARGLRDEQATLDRDTNALADALVHLRAAQTEQAQQGEALDRQLAAIQAMRKSLEAAGAEAQRRAAAEAARADSLRSAVVALETARSRAEAQAREEASRADRQGREGSAGEARQREASLARQPGPGLLPQGLLMTPVVGTVVRSWGEATGAGPSNGMSYRPAPQARVVAPCGGRVRFSGPFRSYGAILIVDCGGGFAFVLAGLDRLDASVGTVVLAGEPIGTMPGWDAAGAGPRPALYIELRHDGQAVNPAPYLRGKG